MNFMNMTVPVIQGGMGVGVSLGSLAGAVARQGGAGTVSTAQIGFREEDFSRNPLDANLRAIGKEIAKAKQLAAEWNVDKLESSYPLSFVGTGAALNEATMNGLDRAANFLGIELTEVMNRATITGSIDIGRNPGVVTVTLLVPMTLLEKVKLDKIAEDHYR